MKKILMALISLLAINSLCNKLTAPEYIGSITAAVATVAILVNGSPIRVLFTGFVVGLVVLYTMILLKIGLKKIDISLG